MRQERRGSESLQLVHRLWGIDATRILIAQSSTKGILICTLRVTVLGIASCVVLNLYI